MGQRHPGARAALAATLLVSCGILWGIYPQGRSGQGAPHAGALAPSAEDTLSTPAEDALDLTDAAERFSLSPGAPRSAGALRGRVLDEVGDGVPAAEVLVATQTSFASDDGSFVVPWDEEHPVRIKVGAPDFYSDSVFVEPPQREPLRVELRRKRSILGKVVDHSGRPLAYANVSWVPLERTLSSVDLLSLEHVPGLSPSLSPAQLVCDALGTFEISLSHADSMGGIVCTATAPGSRGEWSIDSLEPGVTEAQILTSQVRPLAGVVLGHEGEPLAGRRVWVRATPGIGASALGEAFSARAQTRTDSLGQFEFTGLAEREYSLAIELADDWAFHCGGGRPGAAPLTIRAPEISSARASVQIRSSSGAPMAGARVTLMGAVERGAIVGDLTSDPGGFVEAVEHALETQSVGPLPESFDWVVRAPHRTWSSLAGHGKPWTAGDDHIELMEGYSVRLTAQDGQLAARSIQLVDVTGLTQHSLLRDSDSEWHHDEVLPGAYRIEVRGQRGPAAAKPSMVHVIAEPIQVKCEWLDTITVQGAVLDAGVGQSGWVVGARQGGTVRTGATAQLGAFSIDGLHPEEPFELYLRRGPQRIVLAIVDPAELQGDRIRDLGAFDLGELGSLELMVHDTAGEPVAGATVYLGLGLGQAMAAGGEGQTDRGGHFRATFLAPGEYCAVVTRPGSCPTIASVAVPAGDDASLSCVIEAGRELTGRVVDERMRPVSGVEVVATWDYLGGTGAERAARLRLLRRVESTDEEGRFLLTQVGSDATALLQIRQGGNVLGSRMVPPGPADPGPQVFLVK